MSDDVFRKALKEAKAAVKGDKSKGTVYEVELAPIDPLEIRQNLGMSQRQFAAAFGLSLGSIRNWEQERSEPDVSMQSYLTVIKHAPSAVLRALEKERGAATIDLVQ